VTLNLRHNQIGKEGGIALREAVSGHKYLVRVFLDDNAIQIRDIEDIDRMCLKNREERAKRRMPQYEQELGLLVKGHKHSEVQETFLQLGLLKMTFEGADQNRVVMEQELKEIKKQRREPDSEIDHYHMVMGDLDEVIAKVDQELHEVERAAHEKRMELELERKKHEIHLRDAVNEVETMHN
jgi:hypothetical protein